MQQQSFQRPAAPRPSQPYQQQTYQQRPAAPKQQEPALDLFSLEVIAIKVMPAGNVKALFDIALNGVILYAVKLVQEPGKRAWVPCPNHKWKNEDTKQEGYKTHAEWPSEWKPQITDALLEALEECQRQQAESCPPETFGAAVRTKAGIGGQR